jgi:hypothetical protein
MFGETYKAKYSNPHTLNQIVYRICETVTSFEVSELKLVLYSLFKRLEVCLRAEGRCFEGVL